MQSRLFIHGLPLFLILFTDTDVFVHLAFPFFHFFFFSKKKIIYGH